MARPQWDVDTQGPCPWPERYDIIPPSAPYPMGDGPGRVSISGSSRVSEALLPAAIAAGGSGDVDPSTIPWQDIVWYNDENIPTSTYSPITTANMYDPPEITLPEGGEPLVNLMGSVVSLQFLKSGIYSVASTFNLSTFGPSLVTPVDGAATITPSGNPGDVNQIQSMVWVDSRGYADNRNFSVVMPTLMVPAVGDYEMALRYGLDFNSTGDEGSLIGFSLHISIVKIL